MNIENLLTSLDVSQRNRHLSVETAGAKQGRIENIGTVGCSDDDHPFLGIETIHLNKEGIQGLLALVMTTAHAVTTMATNRVNLINEDQTRSVLFALFEHVANTAGTHTDEHFDKVRSADRKEWNVRLTGNRTSEKSLTRSRRTYHQNTFRDLSTERLELTRVPKEINDFEQLFLGLLNSSNIFEGHLLLIHRKHLGFGLPKAHRPLTCRLHLMAEKEEDQRDQKKDRKEAQHHLPKSIVLAAGFDVGFNQGS